MEAGCAESLIRASKSGMVFIVNTEDLNVLK